MTKYPNRYRSKGQNDLVAKTMDFTRPFYPQLKRVAKSEKTSIGQFVETTVINSKAFQAHLKAETESHGGKDYNQTKR